MRLEIPGLLFMTVAILAAFVQRSYVRRLAETSEEVKPDAEVVDRIMAKPQNVFRIAIPQAFARLATLRHPANDAVTERLRLALLGLIAVDLFILGWIVWG